MNPEFGDASSQHGGPNAAGAVPHDFSTNANACGPCPAALAAVRAADPTRYPDPASTALRERLAQRHDVDARRVLIAGSASEFIHRMSAAVATRGRIGGGVGAGGGVVQVPPHGYGDYARAAEAHGLVVSRGRTAVGDASLAWCCDPGSPIGQADAALDDFVLSLEPRTVCVLDLAYEPLRLSGVLSLSTAGRDRIWQLWTPNKALGLTGVRGAYAIAPAVEGDLVERLLRLAPSWPVGADGAAMLRAWTDPDVQGWLADSLPWLRAWKARQRDVCQSLGWDCRASDANFFCARIDERLEAMAVALRREGIQLRDATPFGLPGQVRLGVLPPASQDALAAAWRGARAALSARAARAGRASRAP